MEAAALRVAVRVLTLHDKVGFKTEKRFNSLRSALPRNDDVKARGV